MTLSTQEEITIGGYVWSRCICMICKGTRRADRFVICEACDEQGFQWKRVRRAP